MEKYVMSEQQTDPQVFNFMPAEDHEDAAVLAHLKEHYNENAFEGVPPSFFSDYVVLKCKEALSRPVEYENQIVSDMIDAHDKLLLLRSMTDEEDLSLFDLKSFFNATILKLAPEVREKWEAYKQTPEDKDEIIGRSKKRVLFNMLEGLSGSPKYTILSNIPSGNAYGLLRDVYGNLFVFCHYANSSKNDINKGGGKVGDVVPILKNATEEDVCNMVYTLMNINGEKNTPPVKVTRNNARLA